MITLNLRIKLKRKFSGRKIRKEKRQNELKPIIIIRKMDYDTGQMYDHQYRYEHKSERRYWRNSPQKKYKDNPNLYKGEIFNGYGTLRQPRKCRKTAWKRYEKIKQQQEEREKSLLYGKL